MNLAIGIEIGGTKLQVGIGREDGSLAALSKEPVEVALGAAGIRQALPGLIAKALREGSCSLKDICAIGVGFGGPVDVRTGVVLVSNQIEGWNGFPLRAWFEELYALPVAVENDANAAGYAEALVGAGKGYQRVLYITIGSGIGGGWIVNGVIDNGQGIGAAEIGHTWVPHPESGAPVELELIASGWSIERRAREALMRGLPSLMSELAGGDPAKVSGKIVYAAAEAGDPLALKLLDETCEALAIGIANALNLYHAQRVIIGGGVSLMGKLWWDALREKTRRYVFAPFSYSYDIVPAALGESVVVVGALLLSFRAARTSQGT